MHKIPLISFNANQFINTFLYQSLEKAIFYDEKLVFSSRLNERRIRKFFGSENGIIINPHKYRFKLLKVLLEFDSLNVAIAIASFTDADEYTSYLLLKNNNNHYEITVLSEELREIDVSGYEKNVINKNLNESIIEIIKNKKINNISPYVYNPFYSQDLGGFIYSCRRCSQEFIDVARLVIKNRVGAKSIDEIYPTAVILNVDTDNPLIDGINFIYNDVAYLYWCFADENSNLDKNNDLGKGEVDLIYLDPILEIANQKFIRGNQDIFAKDDLIKKKDACEKILRLSFEKKYTIRKIIDDGNPNFYFEELGKDCFVLFEEDIYIYVSRNTDIEDYVSFTYDEVIKDSSSFKKAIQDYIYTESKEYREFLKTSKKFLDKGTTYEEALSLKEKVIKLLSQVVSEDRKKAEFKGLESEINKKVEQLNNVDKKKISKVLRLISDIKDYETYEKYIDDLTCSVDELSEVERSIVKKEYENFLDTYGGYSDYDVDQKTYRRVFIRKSALEMLRRIDLDESNLKIIEITDAIVDKLKTIPGNELGRYLVSKGLNLPYKKDHAVKKIRIMRNAEYRLLFVYGKDLGEERSENSGAIYIFAVTTHDKDKKELYNLSENRPTTYEINDFIIYPSNKNITIPECTKEQYEIASKYLNRPTITFGCAGSGKTTVSIEQYVSIIYNEFNSVSVGPEELVYVTFHKPLANKVERDLAEYKINGNCYRLEEYFAYVLGVDFDKDKCVNEALFIKWYKKTYSSEALKKNKYGIRERIAYIKDKEDVERLIYTYYRGVFKGSKLLLNTDKPHLSKEEFVNIAMHEEEYLSEEEKETIYNICLEFDEYIKKNGLFSDNDYALNVIRQSHYGLKKTNRIIIDEVQDFTEIEIIATILTLSDNSNNIYYYGDPHQSINPNLFKYETIRQIYYELKKVEPYDSMPLSITYRTNVNLIKYLNKLLDYRKVWIGLTEGGLPKIQMPKQEELSEEENAEDITWAGYVTNVDLYKKIFESNPNSIIITPSDIVKEEVLKRYPFILNKDSRVITIYEAKGREWETIIMYNMFTDYEKYFMDMINGKAKASTIHRMTFNKYYVGCTRATRNFILIEENKDLFDSENPIYKTFLSSFAPIYKEEQIGTYIMGQNTFDGWYNEALQSLDNDDMALFDQAISFASRLATTAEQKRKLQEIRGNDLNSLLELGNKFLKEGNYDLAKGVFKKCNALSNRKHEHYFALSLILNKQVIMHKRLIDELLNHREILDEYKEAIPLLLTQPLYIEMIKDLHTKLFKKKEK